LCSERIDQIGQQYQQATVEQRLEFYKLRKDIISLKPSQNAKASRKLKVKEDVEDDPRDIHPAKRFFMVSAPIVFRYP